VTPQALSAIRHAVCAIGWIPMTSDEFYAEPQLDRFEIEGTGFLVTPRNVATCAHVIVSLQRKKRKRGQKAFTRGIQFVYPPASGGGEMSTVFRSFERTHLDARIDIAVLELDGSPVACSPVRVVSANYVPIVGEAVGLCGYAHGSTLLTRGKDVYRFGPVVQSGIIAALSPFDRVRAESAILDLVTGPAASGSPVFRQETGEVLGVLVEGQIKGHAAFSIARLTYRDATTGVLTAGVGTVQMVDVIRSSRER